MSEKETKPIPVIVVDDVCRFPLHVWRCLSRSINIDIGEVDDEDNDRRFWAGKTSLRDPLTTPDGRAMVWWIPAGGSWRKTLKRVLKRPEVRANIPFFLLDVRGKSSQHGKRKYRVQEALEFLKKFEKKRGVSIRDRIWIVSSYAGDPIAWSGDSRGTAVRPKSPETLRDLSRELLGSPRRRKQESATVTSPEKSASRAVVHLLVTGAGFEIEDRKGGFGLPKTSTLLHRLGEPFRITGSGQDPNGRGGGAASRCSRSIELRASQRNGEEAEGFPHPVSGPFEDPNKNRAKAIRKLAEAKELDDYWDLLLEKFLDARLEDVRLEKRREAKESGHLQEYEMRNAFRRAVLRYDWGYLNHCLDAARLNWGAWLSTNYTRFADRAIALVEAEHDRKKKRDPEVSRWRSIATANEADVFSRELLHREITTSYDTYGNRATESYNGQSAELDRHRFLFKLHGDVAHLQTMAIAGHDKEIYNRLSVPVDSLHRVYWSAEHYLTRSLRESEALVIWHIVGHALKDRLLRNLIGEVCKASGNPDISFVIVQPGAAGEPGDEIEDTGARLKKVMRGIRSSNQKSQALKHYLCRATAQQYLARIQRCGGLENRADRTDPWLKRLGAEAQDTE